MHKNKGVKHGSTMNSTRCKAVVGLELFLTKEARTILVNVTLTFLKLALGD